MAAAMFGADSEELERIATELEAYEDELGHLLSQGVGSVALLGLSATLSTIWAGPRANEFAGVWQSRHLLRVRDVQATLKEAATDLRKNASEQRRTSSRNSGLSSAQINRMQLAFKEALNRGIGFDSNHTWPLFPPLVPLFPSSPPFLGGSPPNFPDPHTLWKAIEIAELGGAWFLEHGDVLEANRGILSFGRFFQGKPYLRNAFEWSDELGTFGNYASRAGTAISAISLTSDIAVLTNSLIEDGLTWENALRAGDALWTGAGMAFPPVGWTKMAWDTGNLIGDLTFHHTPLGEYLMNAHPGSEHIRRAEVLNSETPELLKAGRFDEAHQINKQAMEEAKRAREESEGAKGLWNATKTTLSFGLF